MLLLGFHIVAVSIVMFVSGYVGYGMGLKEGRKQATRALAHEPRRPAEAPSPD